MKNAVFIYVALIMLLSGCDSSPLTPETTLPSFVTSTLPPSITPPSSQIAVPPTVAPTIVPIPGATTSEVNVRVEPSTAGQSLGTIPPFSTVQVTGKESFGYWLRIVFNDGTGWVRAEYVQVPAEIPLVDVGSVSGSGMRGAILRGVNVRGGPGREFESLGLLNQYDIVFISGRDSSGAWMQIAYPPAPDGTGWVNAEFVEMDDAGALPVLDDETPMVKTPESAPAQTAAFMDGDTADTPLAAFTLSPASARAVRFHGEVSSPGDSADWIAFSSSHAKIVIQILCGHGAVQVELIQTGGALIACGDTQSLKVEPGLAYLLKITPVSTGDWAYAGYELRIEGIP